MPLHKIWKGADNDKCAELAEMTFYANGKAVSPIAVWGSPTEKGNMHVLAKHVADGQSLLHYLSLGIGGGCCDLGPCHDYRLPGVYAPE